jgi:hypothetical protein
MGREAVEERDLLGYMFAHSIRNMAAPAPSSFCCWVATMAHSERLYTAAFPLLLCDFACGQTTLNKKYDE